MSSSILQPTLTSCGLPMSHRRSQSSPPPKTASPRKDRMWRARKTISRCSSGAVTKNLCSLGTYSEGYRYASASTLSLPASTIFGLHHSSLIASEFPQRAAAAAGGACFVMELENTVGGYH